jgi:hypothetical protein
MNPPPMNKLRIADGNTRNAESTRKPKKYKANAPTMIRLRTMPSMKLKYPIGITQGNTLAQAEKKIGDNSAAALRPISAAATKKSTAGIHQYFNRKGGRENGPYNTPPEGIILGPDCMNWVEGGIGVGICLGILVL